MDPTPMRAPQKSGGNYFVGLGLGLIPLLLLIIGIALSFRFYNPRLSNWFYIPIALDIIALITGLVFLFISRVRWTGYGLLTAALVSPVVTAISCLVIISNIHF